MKISVQESKVYGSMITCFQVTRL